MRIMTMMAFSVLALIGSAAYANESLLPKSVYGGYWVMTEPFLGRHTVIDFQEMGDRIISNNYQFACHDDGTFTQLSATPTVLVPQSLEFLVYQAGQDTPASRLQLVWVLPKEGLILKQFFGEQLSALKAEFPEGMQFAYAYSPVLSPLCGSND